MKICAISNFRSLHVRNRARFVAGLGHEVEAWSLSPVTDGEGIRGRMVPFVEIGFRPLRGLSYARHLLVYARAIRETRADVYYLQYAAQMECWLALAAGVRPQAVGVMGGDVLMDEQGNLTPIEKALTRLVLKSADAVASKSDLITRRLLHMGVDPKRITKIVWGVDLKRFHPGRTAALRSRFGLADDDLVVFSPRSLTRFYNIHLMVEAFHKAAATIPNAKLLISRHAEDPAYRREIETAITEMGLEDKVQLIGVITHGEMPGVYALADLCVSLAPSDGLPMSAMEAMACGCPLVLTDLECYRELAKAEAEALYVPLETDRIAETMIRVLSDKNLRASLSAAARVAVAEKANMATDLERMAILLEDLRAKPQRGRVLAMWQARLLLALKLALDPVMDRFRRAKEA